MTQLPTRTLSEHESKRLLAAHGVPVLEERLVATPDAAVAAAAEMNGPVAVKLCAAGLAHKTERGLVRLGVSGADAVRSAAGELLAAATPDDREVGVLVAPMVRGTRELIAGLQTDGQFGRCVMIGIGGVLAEALADVAFRLVPIERVDAEDMIDQLRLQGVLGKFRGEPPVDRGLVTRVLLGLSELATSDESVVAADVNPLVVVDGRPVAVDALVEVTAS